MTTIDPTALSRAFAYAVQVHDGQCRKGTDIPYVSHLMAVSGLVIELGGDSTQAVAGLLHDAVEDQGGIERLADVRERFGDEVAGLVLALSDAAPAEGERKGPWQERKAAYLDHLVELVAAGHPAVLVSLCDKIHNARSIVADLDDPQVGPAVFERFSAAPEDTAWMYRALCETYAAAPAGLLPERALAELDGLVSAIEQAVGAPPAAAPSPGHPR